jgi:hypothetical protein
MYAYVSQLTKIDVELPDHPRCRTEALWARPLGGDLYELRTIPCCAEGLHLYDVVGATPDREGGVPRVVGVVRRGEHQVLLVAFSAQTGPGRRADMFRELRQWRCLPEDFAGQLCAFAVEPGGDYAAVCDQLHSWEQEGQLAFEGLHRRLRALGTAPSR